MNWPGSWSGWERNTSGGPPRTRGDAYEVQSYDPAGRLIRLTRLDRLRPEVATEDRDAFLRQRREHLSAIDDPARRRLHESLLDRIPFPERHAGYVDLAVSATGEVWAQRDSVTWDVFAGDGTLLEVRRLPSGIEVFEIGVDSLLAGWRDELGVEHVALYALGGVDDG